MSSPVCSATEDSAPGFVSGGPNQSFGGLVQLCSKDDQVGTGGTTSGIYTIDKTERQSRVPYLHKLPILGGAFKSREVSDSRKELLIFVTPRIVLNPQLADS